MPSLTDLYIGAGISPNSARSIGSVGAATTSGRYFKAKRRRVEQDLATGQKKQSQLNAGELAAVGLSPRHPSGGGGLLGGVGSVLGGVGRLFGNLGKDIGNAALGLPQGVATLGGALVHDINPFHPVSSIGKSELYSKILKPTFEQYKQTYGSGNVLHNIYEHPLGPILDVATLASLGAGGAARVGEAAVRAGSDSSVATSLAKLRSTEGRPDAFLPGSEVPIHREYTPRPLARGGQVALDKLGSAYEPLGDFQARRADARLSRLSQQEHLGEAQHNIAGIVRPIALTARALDDPDVREAYALAIRGVNTPELLSKYEDSVKAAMADPAVVQKREALGIPEQVQARRAQIPDRVKRLVLDPTFEPESQAKMQEARRVWESDVQLGLSKLPIEPEVHAARIGMAQRALTGAEEVTPPTFAPGQIEPGYAPDVQATNVELHTPRGTLSKIIPGMKPGVPEVRVKGRQARRVDPGAVTSQNIFVPQKGRYLHDASGETFMQGLFRSDPAVWVEHSVRREKDLTDKAFKRELVESHAEKNADGEVRKFKSTAEFRESGLANTHVLVNPDYPIAWFHAETNFTKEAARTIKALREAGDEANETVVQNMLDQLTDADAKAFLSSHFMAMKRPGVAVPNSFFEYQRQLARVSDPFENPAMRAYAKLIHHWRNTVLAYMPRWGLNTAIGSFVTNVVKGVVNPMDYVRGNRYGRQYETDAGDVLTRPTAIARAMGRPDLNFAEQRLHKVEPAGVSLQGEARQEMLDTSHGLGMNTATRKLVEGVQHIEDFFRRGSFQQSLRAEGKRWDQSQGADLQIDGNHIEGGHTREALANEGTADPIDVFHGTSENFEGNPTRKPGEVGVHVSTSEGEAATYAKDYATRRMIPMSFHPKNTLDLTEMSGPGLGILDRISEQVGAPVGALRHGEKGDELNAALRAEGYDSVKMSDNNYIALDDKILRSPGHASSDPMPEMGDVIADNLKAQHQYGSNVDEWIRDPRLVQRALRDTNKFGYNYGALGPFERRYVRQFMPFYGWYKFISTLAGRLPVEYPGRTAALVHLGQIGNDMYDELGLMPDWIKGSIILGVNKDGTIKYLPGRGMNPFSGFFNPLNPGGTVQQVAGMLNPVLQAGLQGIGYDTLTGDAVRVSPESGVGRTFSGQLVSDKTGQPVSLAKVQPYTRFGMGLARSMPIYRLGEKYVLEGGASVYPEHVPFFQERLMAPQSEDALTTGGEALSLSVAGINPRSYNLRKFQQLSKKSRKYVLTRNRRSIARTKAKFNKVAP
jgi:hypothetical protein